MAFLFLVKYYQNGKNAKKAALQVVFNNYDADYNQLLSMQSIGHPHLGHAFCMAQILPQVPSHQEEIMGCH